MACLFRDPPRMDKVINASSRAEVHCGIGCFRPTWSERYANGGLYYRRHSNLLACILRDLATCGDDGAVAAARLIKSMNLMTKRADVMDLRARFYGPLTRKARIKLMLEGAAMGQYRSGKQGGVRIRNAMRDIVACLFY